MLISLSRRFIFVANIKTASTTIEDALHPLCEIAIQRSEWGKHIGLSQIQRRFDWVFHQIPLEEFFVFGVMRDPIDWLSSMYRSHTDEKFKDRPSLYTGDLSFDDFLVRWMANHPDMVRPQTDRLKDNTGSVQADLIIPFESVVSGLNSVASKFDIELKEDVDHLNKSPERRAPTLNIQQLARIQEFYNADYCLLKTARQAFNS